MGTPTNVSQSGRLTEYDVPSVVLDSYVKNEQKFTDKKSRSALIEVLAHVPRVDVHGFNVVSAANIAHVSDVLFAGRDVLEKLHEHADKLRHQYLLTLAGDDRQKFYKAQYDDVGAERAEEFTQRATQHQALPHLSSSQTQFGGVESQGVPTS